MSGLILYLFHMFCVVYTIYNIYFLLCFRVRLFIDVLWSLAWKGLTSWLVFVMSNCEVVTFPLVHVSWGRCVQWHSFVTSNCEVVTFPLVFWVRCGA